MKQQYFETHADLQNAWAIKKQAMKDRTILLCIAGFSVLSCTIILIMAVVK